MHWRKIADGTEEMRKFRNEGLYEFYPLSNMNEMGENCGVNGR